MEKNNHLSPETAWQAGKGSFFCCLAILFVTSGIAGWIYEMLFYRINDGMFIRRGQGIGPWLPIYAFGSLFIFLIADRLRDSKLKVFLAGALISGTVEFVTGWVLFHMFGGLRLWDYNTEIWNWGNVGGYICLRSILLFALAGLAIVYLVFPVIRLLSQKLPRRIFFSLSLIPFFLFMADILGGYILKLW